MFGTNQELLYVLCALVINNFMLTVIVIVNMRRIIRYVNKITDKVNGDALCSFEYLDDKIGAVLSVINDLDDAITAFNDNGKSQEMFNVTTTEYVRRLDKCIQNVNATVAQMMSKHTETINRLVCDTRCAFDNKAAEFAAEIADIPNWAVYYTTPSKDKCVKISRKDIHKYSKLDLCQCTSSDLNLSGCTFDTVYVNTGSLNLLYASKTDNLYIKNLEFVLNFNCAIHETDGQLRNVSDAIRSHISFQNIQLSKQCSNVTIDNVIITVVFYPLNCNNEFMQIFGNIFATIATIAKNATINIKINSQILMIEQIKRKYTSFDNINESNYSAAYGPINEWICKNYYMKCERKIQTDCDIPYDYAKNELRVD